jgi:hypothetical protein
MNRLTGAERVKRRRDKMRAAGPRPVQIWVPDTNAPGFAAERRRQYLKVGMTIGLLDDDVMLAVYRALAVFLGLA